MGTYQHAGLTARAHIRKPAKRQKHNTKTIKLQNNTKQIKQTCMAGEKHYKGSNVTETLSPEKYR